MKKIELDKELLYKIYVTENHNLAETTKILNEEYNILISERSVKRNIRNNHFEKSQEQIQQSRKNTIEKKYGVINAGQIDGIVEKINKTKIERYGNTSYNNRDKFKETCLKKYGSNSYTNRDKFKDTMIKKYNVEYPSQNRFIRLKAQKTAKNTLSQINNKRFDSKYEALVYDFCLRNNISVETQVPIEYNYKGKKHITFIDFRIDGLLFECKGGHLLAGIYDYKGVPIKEKLEVYKDNHVILITDKKGSKVIPKENSFESNGLRYQDKCPNPLIGIDIELFKEPKIPYDENKPKCFYDVRVDNNPSVNEAWDNEELRWRMIKNRIEYSGGFITNKQILKAMNITRTCKQPSWFSKSFAKSLIKKYITTDLILDPFAGWGARCDASLELGKSYKGGDLNKELVKWHQSLKRPIELIDANNFKSNEENCSVFICPPYTDFETYFDGQDLKTTQCEWLQKIMENIPNAKEYLMVCKVVDPGWEKYIVEEKINKSHFGINKEYVILIK